MTPEPEKINLIDALSGLLLTIVFATASVATLLSNKQIAGVILSALTLLFAWGVIKAVRRGVRPPTQWERVRAWMNLRPILIGVLGFALVAAIATYGPRMMPILTQEMKIAPT